MSDQYVGEIRMFGGNFAIAGWAFCNGATQSISQNTVLFQVLCTTYGGDGPAENSPLLCCKLKCPRITMASPALAAAGRCFHPPTPFGPTKD